MAQPDGRVVAAVLVLGDDDHAHLVSVRSLERGEALGAHLVRDRVRVRVRIRVEVRVTVRVRVRVRVSVRVRVR